MKLILFSAFLSFTISMLLGRLVIPLFNKLHMGQPIRTSAPESHMKKAGTPTLGGLIFIASTILTMSIFTQLFTIEVNLILLSFILFALVGFVDDILKVYRGKNEGLTPCQKMLLLCLVSLVLIYCIMKYLSIGSDVIVPIYNKQFDLKIFYVPCILFLYLTMTNSVNLTDGLDGLASSVSIIVLIFFAIISFWFHNYSVSMFSSILAAALLGFLRYNSFPATIIMGDTGSIALGGAIASIAIVLKLELILILVGGIYLLETLTALIQILYYKFTRKRIFKMAPIHHSFEMSGVHESKIVCGFSIATVILCLVAILVLL